MKRMILCLVALLAAGSAFAADAPANQNAPIQVDRPAPVAPAATLQCTSTTTALPQLQLQDNGVAAATNVSCDQCWAWFAECMEGCWELGWGPSCKNACLAAKNQCLSQCE